MLKTLSEQEKKERLKEIDKAIISSDELIKDFSVYIAVFESNTRHQTSHITKEEYDKMQNTKYIGSKHEDRFFKDLPDDDLYVNAKTLVLNNDNIAMAFHPMIWKVLTMEERVTALRLAWKLVHGEDVNELCNYYTTTVVFVGKNYQGSLNLGSMLTHDGGDGPWNMFKSICNAKNQIKYNYYFNKNFGKEIKYITDFESFEQMQYLSPLEPKVENIDEMSNELKAVLFNQLSRRKQRENYRQANYFILDHTEELRGLLPIFDEALENDIEEINQTERLINEELGYFQKDIDEEYLRIKVDIFNNITIKEHNKLIEIYQNLTNQIEDIEQPFIHLRKKIKNLKAQKEHAIDSIDISLIDDEIQKTYKQINKCKKKLSKKDRIKLKFLYDKSHEIYEKIVELKGHIITLEQAKEHFKDYFDEKPSTYNINKDEKLKSDKKNTSSKSVSKDLTFDDLSFN